jgi:hypothetical protein
MEKVGMRGRATNPDELKRYRLRSRSTSGAHAVTSGPGLLMYFVVIASAA